MNPDVHCNKEVLSLENYPWNRKKINFQSLSSTKKHSMENKHFNKINFFAIYFNTKVLLHNFSVMYVFEFFFKKQYFISNYELFLNLNHWLNAQQTHCLKYIFCLRFGRIFRGLNWRICMGLSRGCSTYR